MSQPFQHQNNLIGTFAQHPVAANLLMIMMILAGVWALTKLNTQFFPNFALDIITVRVVWVGATAEDVQESITRPIEQELRALDSVRKMTSTSANGVASITLEYEEGKDMGEALDLVNEKVALLRNLPSDAEKPEITHIVRYDPIARVMLTGTADMPELRQLAQQMERQLLDRGISKVDIEGLPEEEISIQISSARLEELGLSLNQVSERIRNFSRDVPAGSVGRNDMARQLRSLEQRRDTLAFTELPLTVDNAGNLIRLGDVAHIERRPQDGEARLSYQGEPAVSLMLWRTETSDALDSAKILQKWLADTRPQLPPSVNVIVLDEAWSLIAERIDLLLRNGVTGLVFVVAVLFLFLNARVAFWVAVGIPVSLMGMLAVLYAVGGSINMVSLFAMIMALGVIVDDAIVVGEDAFTHYQMGENSLLAAEGGAQRMLAPVTAASLTTISAFLPLMMISGVIGNILFDIPVVMICVLVASLIECFFVLPGHLRHTFIHIHAEKSSGLRRKLEAGFNYFRDRLFRPVITVAVEFRWALFTCLIAAMLSAIGLLAGGRVNFTFFPSPEATIINANVNFISGTAPAEVDRFLRHVETTLYETEQTFEQDLVFTAYVNHGQTAYAGPGSVRVGDQFGSVVVEMISPDQRSVRNKQFIEAWKQHIQSPAGLESLVISERRGGPPGEDIEVRFVSDNPENVKAAALDFAEVLKTYEGVSAITDDMPYGQEQWIYSLTPEGKALGLSTESIGQQLRAAYSGQLVQIFQDGEDEVEVRVSLPDDERYNLANLQNFTIRLPSGDSARFSTVVELRTRRGFETLRHAEGQLAAQVSARVDKSVNNANQILAELDKPQISFIEKIQQNFNSRLAQLKADLGWGSDEPEAKVEEKAQTTSVLPQIAQQYGVHYSFEGRAADQRETLQDMLFGLVLALSLMYLILAWQFASYGWPLIVLTAIPFGLVGAIWGHWMMGIDLTILSLFGFFGLSGIVVNDSIVLVTFYRHLRADGMAVKPALIEASCQRLRAVLLTSLTTIFGLMPLLFETSLQAQFLIPMATSIAFGLMFSTVLVLLAVPALLSIYERLMLGRKVWEAV